MFENLLDARAAAAGAFAISRPQVHHVLNAQHESSGAGRVKR
jgi:hypothetical protein